ncbi:MAG: FAD-dependent oxidoreductase [Deltaproteobacteria bacterium]|nr:FAD-dependent oxidoreductase [Deltaproteobacteria bacterium]MBW1927736.1 FAD-dependent oxidoreductase [Deltaproteobacteria bacterium]
MDFPYLFSSISVRNMELRNRIVMTAMHLGYTPEGEVTDQLVGFYEARAKGGVGLIIVGGCPIDEYGGMAGMIGLNHDRFIPGLKRLTSAVQAHGAKIAAQLYQAGRYTHSAMIGGRKPFSASAVRSRLTGETPRALEIHEIPAVQDKFAEAALRAKKAGFDAVEILGSAGYLICQFLSPLTNKRDDEYGGPLENRMRFGLEVVQKVRSAVGPDYPILMRIAGNDFMEGSHTNREARIFASELEKVGVDLFNVTGGWHETRVPQLTMFVPRRAYVYLAQGIKSAVSVPVLASNRINDPAIGEEIIRNGEADLVTMARALLADPELPNKAKEGKAHLIYHCVACNQGCFDNIFQLRPASCLVNPRAGKEGELALEPAPKVKKVLVIGGGPAGMKAACIAAERGHKVILMERGDQLGGQILLNRQIPGRQEMLMVAKDLERNLPALGVDIRLHQEAERSIVEEIHPDVVVVATGAQPIRPDIPGAEGPNVVQAWEVLAGRRGVGGRIVIVGGNAVGLETALYLANVGTLSPDVLHFLVTNRAETWDFIEERLNKGNKEVIVVEMAGRMGQDIGLSSRWTVMAELRRLGVALMTATKAVSISEGGVEVEKADGKGFIKADSVVLAMGSRAEAKIADDIRDLVQEVYVIGDAKEPRNALEAIREGFIVGLNI